MQNLQVQTFTPAWAMAGGIRIDPLSPSMARWQALQPLLTTLSGLLDVEIAIIDTEYLCVAGTGPYEKGLGYRVPEDTALGFSLRSGEGAMVLNPGIDNACIECSIKDRCRDRANYTGPVRLDGQVAAALQIVAFNHHQRAILLEKAESTFQLVCQLVDQLYKTGWIGQEAGKKTLLPAWKDSRAVKDPCEEIVGESPPMRTLKERILQTSRTDSTVLIHGESGTGKELIARAIQKNSARCDAPFITVNCGAMPETLIESELFGYVGGAFSGARSEGRKGLLKTAHGGTIFFDEISDLPLNMQVKLLRALQEHEFLPVGGNRLEHVDVRVLAASNRNLHELVRKGAFRSDLYYRLNVIPLTAPPLRERKEDIPILVGHFLEEFLSRSNKKIPGVTTELMRHFEAYHWPGNVRELKNFIEYGVQFCRGGVLTWEMMAHRFEELTEGSFSPQTGSGSHEEPSSRKELFQARKRADREKVARALEKFGRSVQAKKAAAEYLGISLSTFYRILNNKPEKGA
jgi:DNA-binding NtrC family response regulator